MGGGDLNLKKSWHPSTLRNIERVWKAEQKHEAEQQKIEQLQKELAAERAREEIHAYGEGQGVLKKRSERLDWMYQGPAALVNREDYLMGRKIDKTLELLEMQEGGANADKTESTSVGSIFRPGASTSTVTVDLANKIKEDPLFAIMKREKEQKKSLLNNPVKMKQLKEMLEKSLAKGKKKSKKSTKNKEKKRRKSSSSSSSSDSEEIKSSSKRKDRSYNGDEKYQRTKHQKTDSDFHRSRDDRHRKSNYEQERYRDRKHGNKEVVTEQVRCETRRENLSNKTEYKKGSHYNNHPSSNGEPKGDTKKKLSSAEKERLRQEMMSNAKWREDQRKKNVERYIKEGELEDKVEKGDASSFIRPMLSKAAELGSVENRVKQKIFTIQRKKGDMDTNFARR